MTRLFVPKEVAENEPRTALTPDGVRTLRELGIEVRVQSGLGARADFPDPAYREAGAEVVPTREESLGWANLVLRIRKPPAGEVARLSPGCLQISFLDPFNEPDLLTALANTKVNAISLEMIPRTTLAQKMDALSSQANLAGYASVILAADRMRKLLPMMMTPAGTISPARFLIIGAGVAGLQAIATAKRLGARVEAFDTRPAVEEQVRSLGAKFLRIDLGETAEAAGGYAKELTPEQLAAQQKQLTAACARADVVITTAKVFGRPAPRLITDAMLAEMQHGAFVLDLAAETGGNVVGSQPGHENVTPNGVRIFGADNLEGYYSHDASRMLSANFTNLLTHFWDRDAGSFDYREDDEILRGCLLTRDGRIVHPRFQT